LAIPSEGGKITFDDTGTVVARQESWVAVVANKFKALFTPQEQPAPNHKTEGDMPLTKEELEQIGSMIGQAVATNTEAAIKPLAEKVDALQANQQQLAETLTANSRAEEKAKREAVTKVHGDIVANALSGEALDAMFKSLGEAAPLGTNNAQQHKETGAPAADEHFSKGAGIMPRYRRVNIDGQSLYKTETRTTAAALPGTAATINSSMNLLRQPR
jgi:Skp family chaperone for outer membrane proteins